MFERIRLFYEKRLWTAAMVRQAVDKGLLTTEQYRQIVRPVEPDSADAAAAAAGQDTAAVQAAGGEAASNE